MFPRKIKTILSITMAVSWFIMGCATLHKITRDVVSPDRLLNKKIAVLPFKDLTGSKDNMAGEMAKSVFRGALSEHCKAIIVEDDKRGQYLEEEAMRTSDAVDLMTQNRVARVLGLNAILIGTILNITMTNPAAFLELEVHLYDVETNALLSSELVKSRVNMSEREWPKLRDIPQPDPRLVEALLKGAALQLSEKLCTVMEEEPWKGYVLDFENGKVVLSAGIDVGLRKGDVLEVFRYGRPIAGNADKYYLVSGPMVGEVKIEKVLQHTAVASVISGKDFDKSNCVKLKRE
jgi:hypothetical protein